MANVKISALGAGIAPSSGDEFAAVQSGVTVKLDYDDIETSLLAAVAASVISASKYTDTPANASTITFSDTSDLVVGDALEITHNAVLKYFLVTAIVPNTTVTVSGPTLTGFDITALAKLDCSRVAQVDLVMPGLYEVGGATTDLFVRETRTLFRWQQPPAKLVYAAARHNTVDSTGASQPIINVTIDGSSVLATDITLPNATTWLALTLPGVTLANYGISFASALEIDLVTAAGTLDAKDLIVSLTFILC